MPAPTHRIDRRLGAAVSACAVTVLLAGCVTSGPGSSTVGYITGNGVVTTIAPGDRTDVPAVHGPALSGGTIDIADDRGRVVVINVWASWCPPCRAEAADLVAAAKRLRHTTFIGLDTNQSDQSAAEAFVRDHGIPYDSIFDQDGSVMLSFYGMLSPSSLPSTVVVDTQGRIAALVLGPVDTSTLVGLVRGVAAQP